MRVTCERLVFLSICLALATTAATAKKKSKTGDLLLQPGFPPISDEQRTLTEVPFAKGAPAVVLLDAEQDEWDQGLKFRRVDRYRRIKILTPDGVETYGDFSITMLGDWRVKKVEARTILPDGTVIDAGDSVFREKSDTGRQEIRVAFPQVQPGAILDLYLLYHGSPWTVPFWRVQQELPVLESRYVMKPPRGLRFRQVPFRMPPESGEPQTAQYGAGLRAYVWRFDDVEPLPREFHAPPVDEIAAKLILILESYKDDLQYIPIATDWKSFIEDRREYWEDWLGKGHGQALALAREVVPAEGTPLQKAEAIRQAVRDRVRVDYLWDFPVYDNADQVLENGSGASADLAGLCAAMLRSVGVAADLVAIRRRDEGVIFREIPIPGMLDDMLVRVPGPSGPAYFSPAAELPAGRLPWDCTGLLAVPYAKGADGPVVIENLEAGDNRVERTARASVTAEGALEGHSEHRFHGVAAESLRRSLRNMDADARRERIRQRLGRFMPGVELVSAGIENLEIVEQDLVITCEWRVPGYATRAGSRLIVNPNLFARVSAEEWAAQRRTFPVYLERPYERIDRITLELPEAVTAVEAPEKTDLDAGPAGFYRASAQQDAKTLRLDRHLRVNLYTFDAKEYPQLRSWFTSMAEADDRPAVLKLQ